MFRCFFWRAATSKLKRIHGGNVGSDVPVCQTRIPIPVPVSPWWCWRKSESSVYLSLPVIYGAKARGYRYPLTYSVIVVPVTITCWVSPANRNVPSAARLFASAIFGLSGFLNVILLLKTRAGAGLFCQRALQPPSNLNEVGDRDPLP